MGLCGGLIFQGDLGAGLLLLLGPVPDVDDGAVPRLLLVLSLLGQFSR